MDLTFPKNVVSYLKKLVSQVGTKEETADIIIPEQEPDIGRVISAWAVPVVRSKELRTGSMTVSGGMTAWVLYIPADGGDPRTVSTYIPFSVKWELPSTDQTVTMAVQCQMQSVDARMVSARKILVRGTVACLGEAFVPAEAEFYSLPAPPPKDLEILRRHLPLLLPAEVAEKQFQLEENLELSSGTPNVSRVISYQLHPSVSDTRVLGEKAVFKGTCNFHLVYMTPENRLAVWDTDIPFSQYAELSRHYDQEEEMRCLPLLSSVELEVLDDGRELALNCGMTAQCIVLSKQEVEMVTDLYSLRREVTPQMAQIPLRTRLDHQTMHIPTEVSFPIHGGTVADASLLAPFPRVSHSGDQAVIDIPVWCGIVYYDDTGTLQGKQAKINVTRELKLAHGCPCQANSKISGPIQWSVSGGNANVRSNVELIVDSYCDDGVEVVNGISMGQELAEASNRPSVIICTPDADDTLWSLAKAYGSTVDAIRKANGLKKSPPSSKELLLIPVL